MHFFFNLVTCCFLYKAKDLSAPLLRAFLLIIPCYTSHVGFRSIHFEHSPECDSLFWSLCELTMSFRGERVNLVLPFVVFLEPSIASVLSPTFCVFAPPFYKMQATFIVPKHCTDNGICNVRHYTGCFSLDSATVKGTCTALLRLT
jgi:hypothetical protein